MKKSQIISLLAVSALSVTMLAACGGSGNKKSDSKADAQSAEVFTGATKGTDNFETLSKGVSENGAWLSGVTKDIDASGKTLTVSGLFAGDKQVKRELALYKSGADKKPEGTYTLTVAKLVVKSPGFIIAQGTVKGDVYVDATGFKMQGSAKVDGNLIFASDRLKKAYDALTPEAKGVVTGTTKVEATNVVGVKPGAVTIAEKGGKISHVKSSDVKTGATHGTEKLSVLSEALGKNGTWLAAGTADINGAGKTVKIDGTFIGSNGLIARKLVLYAQNDQRQVATPYTLTVAKLVVNSPHTVIANGEIKGDVYITKSAIGFAAQNTKDTTGKQVTAKIDGNLYFATPAELDAYNKLPATAKYDVTGKTEVKAV